MNEPLQKKSLNSPTFSLSNKMLRLLWLCCYLVLFRFSPTPLFFWRRFLLRAFGSKLGHGVNIYPSAKIWLPGNLEMKHKSTLGPSVKLYNQGRVVISEGATISQGAYICASTHDYNDPLHPLILGPITIGKHAWICADAFIGPNVNVADGCVIGARAVVNKNTESWSVYAGNPARKVNDRERFD
ncbi:putative colanic acid biosynthesis acetyltransferase [Alteromonas sediminis]|uniref:Putative colanic acid biosynthesis acetyltransferase n=1 Tax=Alteromonas sediminis TaxID=2259342 RepID=A0A3N5Y4K8_9ALTE|nr:putative colanic acid biosynthesis acetyltransferase [Alteromonas sediminis]RPJ68510.1 putative colanic acid biosynthesis acetyltransferase [Alteromonas sediminis]